MLGIFDFVILLLVLGGGILGYRYGVFKTLIRLSFIVAPSIALAYFGSDIASIGNTIAGMLKDSVSAPLGIVGAGSGLLGMIGIVGSFFLGSRIVISLMDLHDPGKKDKLLGAGVGIVACLLLALPIFILAVKISPIGMSKFVQGVSWSYVRPAVVALHPPINRFIDQRMAGLVNGLSDNQLIANIASGKNNDGQLTLIDMVDTIQDIDIKEVMRLQKAARALDPKEVEKLLAAYKSGDMSRERLKTHLENPNFQQPN